MRRAGIPLIFVLMLAACSRASGGPAAPIAKEQFTPGPGLDAAAARQTVLDFLNAYAASADDEAAVLSRVVAGPELAAWVRWLNVQNREFIGAIFGQADLRDLEFLGSLRVRRTIGAQLDLSASVTFQFEPVEADSFERTRILDGPVTLVKTGPADWRVLDLTRDGIPMSDGIQLFRREERTLRDVTVHLDSLFMFTPNWQFNLVVENRGDADVALGPDAFALFEQRPNGELERIDGVLTASLQLVPGRSSVEGLLAFPMQDSAEGRILALGYRQGGKLLRFEFPLEGLVRVVPPPPPTDEEPVAEASPS